MPIQPTDYHSMYRGLGQDVGGIATSTIQGAKTGMQIGGMINKFREAETNKKLFRTYQAQAIAEVKQEYADDPRGEKIVKVLQRQTGMKGLTNVVGRMVQLKDIEDKAKKEGVGVGKYLVEYLEMEDSPEGYEKQVGTQRQKGVQKTADEKVAAGVGTGGYTGKQWEKSKDQVKQLALEDYRKKQLAATAAHRKQVQFDNVKKEQKLTEMDYYRLDSAAKSARGKILDMREDIKDEEIEMKAMEKKQEEIRKKGTEAFLDEKTELEALPKKIEAAKKNIRDTKKYYQEAQVDYKVNKKNLEANKTYQEGLKKKQVSDKAEAAAKAIIQKEEERKASWPDTTMAGLRELETRSTGSTIQRPPQAPAAAMPPDTATPTAYPPEVQQKVDQLKKAFPNWTDVQIQEYLKTRKII